MLEPTWFVLPLSAAIALVYNASRYEHPQKILKRSGRMFFLILIGMGILYAALFVLSV